MPDTTTRPTPRDAAYTRGRRIGLAVTLAAFLALTALIVATALQPDPPPPDPIAGPFAQRFPAIRLGIAVLLTVVATCLWSVRSKVLDTPVLELAGARPGAGLYRGVVFVERPVVSPLTARWCAWYRSRRGGQTSAAVAGRVTIADETGSVAIDPSMCAGGPDQRVVYEQGRSGREERVLAAGMSVTLYVDAEIAEDGGLVLVPHSRGLHRWPLVRRVVRNGVVGDGQRPLRLLQVGSLALLAAAGVLWMSIWLVQTWSTDSSPRQSAMVLPREPVRTALVVAGCTLVFFALAVAITRYNRLVALRNQIEYAAGVIEVAAQQRHDLIGSLLGAVQLAADHEHTTLVGVALLRADGADRDRLAAVEQRHPDLGAQPRFVELHDQLVRCEDRLAAARRFHNDAVTVARDRASTFPALLLRPLVFPRGVPALLDFGPVVPAA